MKIRFFKIVIALLVIFTSVYFLNKTILIGGKEKITLFIKVIDNKTGIPLTGVNISISEENTPFKIPLPGTIMKEYHIIYNVKSDSLGIAEFVLKKRKKYIIEFEDRANGKRNSTEFKGIKLENDTITIIHEM